MTIKPPGGSPSVAARATLTALARVARHVDVTTPSGATTLARLRELDTLCTVGKGTMAVMSTFGGPRSAAAAPVDTPIIVDAMGHVAEPMGVMDAIIQQRSATASLHSLAPTTDVDVTPSIWQNSHTVEAPARYGFRQLAPRLDDNGDPIAPRFEVPTPGVHVHRFAEVPGAVVEVHDRVTIEEKRSVSEPIGPDRVADEMHMTVSRNSFGNAVTQPYGAKRIFVDRSFVIEAQPGKRVELENIDSGERLSIASAQRTHFEHLDTGAWQLTVIDVIDEEADSERTTIMIPTSSPRAEVLHGGFGVELIDTSGNELKPRMVERHQWRRYKVEVEDRFPIARRRGQNVQDLRETVVYEDPRLSPTAGHHWPLVLTWRERPLRVEGLSESHWPSAFDDAEVGVVHYRSGSLELQIDGESFFLAPVDNEARGLTPTRPQKDTYRGYVKVDGKIYSVAYRYEVPFDDRHAPVHDLRIGAYDGNGHYPAQMHGIGGP